MENVIYHGQYGEDFALDELFGHKTNGVIIDIGAMEGCRYNNSYFLSANRNWLSICVEPHLKYFELLNKNRQEQNCIKLNCAVSNKIEDNGKFYTNYRGSLSTLDRSMENFFKNMYTEYFGGFEEQKVNIVTLNHIIETYLPENKKQDIDCISIDVEGTELTVLEGLDIEKYKPKIIIAEANKKQELRDYFDHFKYNFLTQIGCNYFFGKNKYDEKVKDIEKRLSSLTLSNINHPLDEGE